MDEGYRPEWLTPEVESAMGDWPDKHVAHSYGLTRRTVTRWRNRLGIPSRRAVASDERAVLVPHIQEQVDHWRQRFRVLRGWTITRWFTTSPTAARSRASTCRPSGPPSTPAQGSLWTSVTMLEFLLTTPSTRSYTSPGRLLQPSGRRRVRRSWCRTSRGSSPTGRLRGGGREARKPPPHLAVGGFCLDVTSWNPTLARRLWESNPHHSSHARLSWGFHRASYPAFLPDTSLQTPPLPNRGPGETRGGEILAQPGLVRSGCWG